METILECIKNTPAYIGLMWYVSMKDDPYPVIDFHFPESRLLESSISFWEIIDRISNNLDSVYSIYKCTKGGYSEIIRSEKIVCHIRLMVLSGRMFLSPILGTGSTLLPKWVFPIVKEEWNESIWCFPIDYKQVSSSFETNSNMIIINDDYTQAIQDIHPP